MSDITVREGVPLPKPKGTARHGTKYPFETMPIGGMFLLHDKTTQQFSTYASLWGRKLDRKFRTRTVWMKFDKKTKTWSECEPDDKGAVQGVGVWRVA